MSIIKVIASALTIIPMEDNLVVKEPYIWDYNIKVKTKDGTFVHEHEKMENIEQILAQHPGYTGIEAKRNEPSKKLVKKRGK